MTSIKHNLNNFYQKLCATKVHLWSHCLALIGWLLIFNGISFLFDTSKNTSFLIAEKTFIFYTLFIIFINLTILELLFFKKFKIKCKFLIKNNYYNIFWIIGISTSTIIFSIIPTICILFYII